MKQFTTVFCLPSLVLTLAVAGCATEKSEPAAKAPEPAPAAKSAPVAKPAAKLRPNQVVDALSREISRKKPAEKLEAYLKLLEDPYVKTNVAGMVYQRIAQEAYVGEKADKAVRTYLDSKDSHWAKRDAIDRYARYRADQGKFDEAIAYLRGELAKEFKNQRDKGFYFGPLVSVCEWADRFDEAVKVCREWQAVDPDSAGRRAIRLAANWEREDVMKEFGAKMSPGAEIEAYAGWGWGAPATPKFVRQKVVAFVSNPSNAPSSRIGTYITWLAKSHEPDALRAYESLMAIPDAQLEKASCWPVVAYNTAFCNADWQRTVDLWNLFSKMKRMAEGDLKTHSYRKHYVVSLARLGRTSEAIAACDRFAADAKDEKDVLRFRGYAAMLRGEQLDTAKLFEGTKLDAKAKSEVVRALARQALAMELCDCAERLSAEWKLLFVQKELRTLNVPFSDTPVRSISDWRTIYPTLEKGYCDQPFGVSAETLVTDVTTQRKIAEVTAEDNQDAKMEITAVCDAAGLHVFLRVADPSARKVESGFAGGIGTEMYFAPGEDVNYQCFGSEPTKGVSWGMNTGYNSAVTKRIDFSGKVGSGFRSEVAFTDDDYVCHFTFDWDNFYNYLPFNGRDWKFECIAWTPKGGMTWSALTQVHAISQFGHLKFSFTKEQETAIRRGLLLRAYNSWRSPASNDGGERLKYFDMWQDDVVGDPDFYANCLKDLQAKLEADAKLVKIDMSDAEVDEVFASSLATWLGLKHEIDDRRRKYLLKKLTSEGL